MLNIWEYGLNKITLQSKHYTCLIKGIWCLLFLLFCFLFCFALFFFKSAFWYKACSIKDTPYIAKSLFVCLLFNFWTWCHIIIFMSTRPNWCIYHPLFVPHNKVDILKSDALSHPREAKDEEPNHRYFFFFLYFMKKKGIDAYTIKIKENNLGIMRAQWCWILYSLPKLNKKQVQILLFFICLLSWPWNLSCFWMIKYTEITHTLHGSSLLTSK